MTDPNKVYVCVVFHHSELRPEGLEMANNFIQSWIEADLGYKLLIVDNESTIEYERLKEIEHTYIRVDDQVANDGVVGAWNDLVKLAFREGAEIIMGFADDVKVNKSLEALVEATERDDTWYGPLTDGMHMNWPTQKSAGIRPGFTEKVKSLNGFWLSFTAEFYNQRKTDTGDMFDLTRKEMGRWCNQENMIYIWNETIPTYCEVIGDCWMHHTKHRSWLRARDKFGN